MKKIIIVVSLFFVQSVFAQNIDRIEYYIDNDPGYGLGAAIPITPGTDIDVTYTIDLGTITNGFHILFIRIRSENGAWSLTHSMPFFKEAVSPVMPELNIAHVEYYIDKDPGYGKGIAVPFSPSSTIDQNFIADLHGTDNGFHVLFVREQDDNGAWSLTHSIPFFKEAVTPVLPELKIAHIEYFMDTDPGYGKGIGVPFSSNSMIDENFIADLQGIDNGFHVLFVREQDENGAWSLTHSMPFFKEAVTPVLPELNIAHIEYYMDTDPGYGKGIAVPFSPSSTIDQNFIADLGGIDNGFHVLFVREQDEKGVWSLTHSMPFFKEAVTPDLPELKIAHIEYYMDTDPGYGKGVAVPFSSNSTIDQNFIADLGGIDNGFHVLFVREQDENGVWSLTHSMPFFKEVVTSVLPELKIAHVEYYMDTDPGYGKGIGVSFSSNSMIDENFIADLRGIDNGFHVLFVRIQDENGVWSLTHSMPFFKEFPPSEKPTPAIIAVEYYFRTESTRSALVRYSDFVPSSDVDITFNVDLSDIKADSTFTMCTAIVDENEEKSFEYLHKFNIMEEPAAPAASFTIFPSSGTTSTTFAFDASSSSGQDLTYRWDYNNDGVWDNPASGYLSSSTSTYQYFSPGTYTVKLEVKNNTGQTATSIKNVTVSGEEPIAPAASFTIFPSSGTTSTTFTFDASSSSGQGLTYRWDYNNDGIWDNPTSGYLSSSTTTYQYISAGTYTVKLEVKNNAGQTAISTNNVTVTPEPFIRVKYPNGGEEIAAGSSITITWESNGVSNVRIEYSHDGESNWITIEPGANAQIGSYQWTVADTPSTNCLIRVSNVDNLNSNDTSDYQFTIRKLEFRIIHTPITEAQQNSPITFTSSVTSGSAIEEVMVHFDKTGERIFDGTLELTFDGSLYKGTLSSALFTAYGIEYYITAKDKNGVEIRFPEDGYFSIRSQVSNMKSAVSVAGGSAQNAYRMISVPLTLQVYNIVDQLRDRLPEGTSGVDWRLFRWSSNEERFKEYPGTDEGFEPGKAFWIIIREGNFTLKSLNGTTVPTDKPMECTLLPGWNDIANPWLFSISWNDIENPTNANISSLYSYEGSWSDPGSIHIIEPWKGYAIRNNENIDVVVRFKPVPVKVSKVVTDDTTILWELSLQAYAGEAKDTGNHLGVREDAEVEWDRYDHVEPPLIGEYVSVSFPHPDWNPYPCDYTVDFRPPSQENYTWDVNVRTNIPRKTVTVEVTGTEKLPDGYSIKVFDLDKGQTVDLDNDTFSFVSATNMTERHFRLVAGDSDKPITPSTEPDFFITATCYPNPFNPRTTIRYELSQPGFVIISVYNTVGQQVKNFDMGYRSQGVHEFIFEAENLTSGLYIYRVTTGYSATTGKMLFMK